MILLKSRSLLVFIFLLMCGNRLDAQAANAPFRNLTSAEGLPRTSVSSITQDVFGFIWIATWDGVYQYDGKKFTKITDIDSRRITADKQGGVWISTTDDEKILYYSTQADSLKLYAIPKGGRSINIKIDDEANVWADGDNGLYKYDAASDSFKSAIEKFNKEILRITARGNGEVLFIFWDDAKKVSKLGYRYSDGSVRYEDFPVDKNNPVQGKSFVDKYPPFGMAFKDSGFIIFNKYGWAYKEKPEGEWTFRKLAGNAVLEDFNDVIIDNNGNAWLNRLNSLQKINPETGSTIIYWHSDADNTSLLPSEGGSGNPFFDRQGVLWVPRFGSGISKLNLYESDFGLLKNDDGKVILDVLSAAELKDSSFFIGSRTRDNGLYHFNPEKKVLKRYGTKSIAAPAGKTISDQLSHPFPWSLCVADNGNVWVGTGWPTMGDGGLNLIKPGSSVITRYKHDSTDHNSIPDDWIFKIYERSDGKLWIVTAYKGWFLFDPQKEISYTGFDKTDRSFGRQGLMIRNDDLIFERNDRYFLVDGKTLQPRQLALDKGNLGSLDLELQDDLGKVWFVCETGFGYLSNNLEKIDWFFDITENNFPAGEITTLNFDNKGKLWLSTDNGLVRFDTSTKKYIHYGIERGLQGNYFSDRMSYKGPSGKLYLGGNAGINVFDPEKIVSNPFAPEMVFTGLKLDGKEIKYGNESAISQPIITAEKIIIGPDISVISIDFAAIHFAGLNSNILQYRLEGFDKEWRDGGTVGNATYTNLPQGKYTLYIRGKNLDGVWSDGKKSISIRVLPPWWQTWWAYSIYGLLFLFVLWLFYRYQRIRTIRKEREKTQKRELEQAKEIEKAYHELKSTQQQLIQSEKMASLGELTAGIAHEIQNPLNFVNNFSDVNSELIDEMQTELDKANIAEAKNISDDIKENEEKIKFHGKRADAIVKAMLQHSRSSSGQKEPTDINALCDEYMRLAYHGLRAKDKSFNAEIKTDFDNTIGNIHVVPQDIGRVILNLINNAFYAVNEKKKLLANSYEPLVEVTTRKVNNKIEISIKDNGNGIPESIKEKIFQPFFTTKPTGQGTGLGLSLSYDIIKAHGGELRVETQVGEGTTFIILLKNS